MRLKRHNLLLLDKEKQTFDKRLMLNMKLGLMATARNRKVQCLMKLEKEHRLKYYKQPFVNLEVINPTTDQSRVHIIAWMEDRIKLALYNISERKMFESM